MRNGMSLSIRRASNCGKGEGSAGASVISTPPHSRLPMRTMVGETTAASPVQIWLAQRRPQNVGSVFAPVLRRARHQRIARQIGAPVFMPDLRVNAGAHGGQRVMRLRPSRPSCRFLRSAA